MALRFGRHDVVFADAPLSVVVCQVRFSPIYALLSRGGVAGFQDSIRQHYPRTEEKRSAEVQVGQQDLRVEEKVPIWLFSDDEGWTVSLAVDFVSLETTSYPNFREFLDRLNVVLEAVRRTVDPSDSTRIGLRKVNALAHPDVESPSDWSRYIQPELVGLLGRTAEGGEISGGAAQVQWTDGDGALVVRHGVWGASEDGQRDLSYHIDLDYSTDRPFAIGGSVDLSELLQDYSNAITSFFVWSLREPMSEYLGSGPRDAPTRSEGDPK